MGLDALCDVAQTMRMDQARADDGMALAVGVDPTAVDDLRESLGLEPLHPVESPDADVIVMAEWSPAEFSRRIAEGQEV